MTDAKKIKYLEVQLEKANGLVGYYQNLISNTAYWRAQAGLTDVERHSAGAVFRAIPGYSDRPPVYSDSPEWYNACMTAILDSLTAEGICAWNGDGTGCVLQIVAAYAKLDPEYLKTKG